MRILALFHRLAAPPESGVTKRTFHLLGELTRRHEVTVVSLGTPAEEAGVRAALGDRCRGITFADWSAPRWVNLLRWARLLALRRSSLRHSQTGRMQRAIDEAARRERFDLVFLSAPVLSFYRRPPGIPCVTDTHNVEYELCRRSWLQARGPLVRAYLHDQYRLLRRDELWACGQGEVLLTVSPEDRDQFGRDLPGQRIRVVPNGVDLDYFRPSAEPPEPGRLVFCGLMGYPPNDQGIRWFLDEVLPLVHREVPEARLDVVGARPARWLQRRATDRITVTGRVPDVRPWVRRAEVYVVPLLVGGGTRLKALEAMAMAKPIVTTSVGCEGIGLAEGRSALFADTPAAFAAAVVRTLRDAPLRARLAAEGRALAERTFGWGAIGERLDAACREAAEAGATLPAPGRVAP